jgi:hypothetical protein
MRINDSAGGAARPDAVRRFSSVHTPPRGLRRVRHRRGRMLQRR